VSGDALAGLVDDWAGAVEIAAADRTAAASKREQGSDFMA
jgi:hypothetical protein